MSQVNVQFPNLAQTSPEHSMVTSPKLDLDPVIVWWKSKKPKLHHRRQDGMPEEVTEEMLQSEKQYKKRQKVSNFKKSTEDYECDYWDTYAFDSGTSSLEEIPSNTTYVNLPGIQTKEEATQSKPKRTSEKLVLPRLVGSPTSNRNNERERKRRQQESEEEQRREFGLFLTEVPDSVSFNVHVVDLIKEDKRNASRARAKLRRESLRQTSLLPKQKEILTNTRQSTTRASFVKSFKANVQYTSFNQ